jgi:hypothetical protein
MSHPSDNYSPEQLWHALTRIRDIMISEDLIQSRPVCLDIINMFNEVLNRPPVDRLICEVEDCNHTAIRRLACDVGTALVCSKHVNLDPEFLKTLFTVDMLIQNYSGE